MGSRSTPAADVSATIFSGWFWAGAREREWGGGRRAGETESRGDGEQGRRRAGETESRGDVR
jgi:hypothetical protein